MTREGDSFRGVFVALGSNQGDRARHISDALARINAHPAIQVLQVAPLCESEAQTRVPGETAAPYLNTVCHLATFYSPHGLHARCIRIEEAMGRERSTRGLWLPRTIDLDILTFGTSIIDTPTLCIPHARMADRLFVLAPLHDLAPNLYIPKPFDAKVSELLTRCGDRGGLRPWPDPPVWKPNDTDDETDEGPTLRNTRYAVA